MAPEPPQLLMGEGADEHLVICRLRALCSSEASSSVQISREEGLLCDEDCGPQGPLPRRPCPCPARAVPGCPARCPGAVVESRRARGPAKTQAAYQPRPDYLDAVQRDGMSHQWRPKIMAWFDQVRSSRAKLFSRFREAFRSAAGAFGRAAAPAQARTVRGFRAVPRRGRAAAEAETSVAAKLTYAGLRRISRRRRGRRAGASVDR